MMGALAGGIGAGVFLVSPLAGYLAMTDVDMSTRTITVTTAPISLICAPVTVPVGVVWAARDFSSRRTATTETCPHRVMKRRHVTPQNDMTRLYG